MSITRRAAATGALRAPSVNAAGHQAESGRAEHDHRDSPSPAGSSDRIPRHRRGHDDQGYQYGDPAPVCDGACDRRDEHDGHEEECPDGGELL